MSKLENHLFLRKKLALEVILDRAKNNPGQRIFHFSPRAFWDHSPLFDDLHDIKAALKRLSKETEENITVEFEEIKKRDESIATFETYIETTIIVRAEDVAILHQYALGLNQEETVNFILYRDGRLVRKDDQGGSCYRMHSTGYRLDLLIFLAEEGVYITTEILAKKYDKSKTDIRKAINATRTGVAKTFNVSKKGFIESNKAEGLGYRIMNVKVKD